MADTVESLRLELNQLRSEFEAFKTYAKPVIDGHQPLAVQPPLSQMLVLPPIPLPK